ncbi:HTH-type transcriptional regulator AdhR [compost metagenome]
MHTVKEAAAILGLTEHTIRYYTDQGLVPSLQRDKNNNRLFDEESMNWLNGVKYLKECGMSIEAIKEYIDLCMEGDSSIDKRYEIILAQKAVAEAQLEQAKQRFKYMQEKADHYTDIVKRRIPDDMNPRKWQ